VLVFSDPDSGNLHGYMDHWDGDVFHYYGEGQRGDQEMTHGNLAILDHVETHRAMRVFKGAKGEVTYLGEYLLDSGEPYYLTESPQTNSGQLRKVIVFRLRPLDG
jgi:hypothetical protein